MAGGCNQDWERLQKLSQERCGVAECSQEKVGATMAFSYLKKLPGTADTYDGDPLGLQLPAKDWPMRFPVTYVVGSVLSAILFFLIGCVSLSVFPRYVHEAFYISVTVLAGLGMTLSLMVAFAFSACWLRAHPGEQPKHEE